MKNTARKTLLLLLALTALVAIVALGACDGGGSGAKLSVTFDDSHKVYVGDSLDDLKPFFSVIYTDKDGATIGVADFTLSGTLTEGESIISVSYNGLSQKVTVTVLEKDDAPQPKEYKVTFDYNGATGGNEIKSIVVTLGQAIGTLPTPTKDNAEFTGWKLNGEIITSETLWQTDGNATLIAQWTDLGIPQVLKYRLNEDENSYSVVGIGTVTDTSIVIPSTYDGKPVTEIGRAAFYNYKDIVSITIPNSVTSIGYQAFYGSHSLESVIFADKSQLESIGERAFSGCSSLAEITIPSSVTSIAREAFYCCHSLALISIPSSVTSIGFDAFSGCSSLESVVFADNSQLTGIGEGAFHNCSSLTEITIPSSVRWIGYWAFGGCSSLTSINYLGTIEGWCGINGLNNLMCDDSGRTLSINGEIVTALVIPDFVISIGEGAFYGCRSLASISIPSSVTSIGNRAFYNCSSLTSVTFAENSQLTSIGKYAFGGCSSLTSIEIPDSVTSIGESTFRSCSSLMSITLPSSVTSIGEHAFAYCCSLTSITLPSSVTSIGKMAFYNCYSLTSITIPSSVTSIGSYVFYGCGLTSITLPSSITSIGEYAFYDCSGLTEITIPSSVTSIGEDAFYGCGLTSITIPSSVTSIGEDAFFWCNSLTIYCEAASKPSGWNSSWKSSSYPVVWNCKENNIADDGYMYAVVGGVRYSLKDGIATVVRQSSNIATANILEKVTCDGVEYPVTSIGDRAFYNCSSFTSITIPSSVTSIASEAFYGCRSLTIYCEAASKPSSWNNDWNEFYSDVHNRYCSVVWNCNENNLDKNGYMYAVIGGLRYSLKDGIAVVVAQPTNIVVANIPEQVTHDGVQYSVTSIDDYAFDGCSSLISITIPSSVTSIGSWAFFDCSSLTSITIPESVTSIGEYAFDGCSSLQYNEYDNALYLGSVDNPYFALIEAKDISITSCTVHEITKIFADYAFSYCRSLTSITIPSSVTSIGNFAFEDCSSLTSITIPSNVTSIGDYAFRGCSSLTEITIPSSITSIGEGAFSGGCSSLVSVVFADNSQLTSIGAYAFYGCSSLTSIMIPSSVTSIGKGAFSYCRSLAMVYWNATACEHAGSYGVDQIFWNCSSQLTTVVIGDNVTIIPSNAFGDCSSLVRVIFADNSQLARIGKGAFSGCSSLTGITIPSSVTSIGFAAFSGCRSLTSITIPSSVTSMDNEVFYGCSGLTIYCEAASKPSGWDTNWNVYGTRDDGFGWRYIRCPVVWRYSAS